MRRQQLARDRELCVRCWSADPGWPDGWLCDRPRAQCWGEAKTPLGLWWCSWNEAGLVEAGFDQLPEALVRDDRQAERYAQQLFSSARRQLPLQLAGTLFQRAVWRLLWLLPEGVVTDYGQLARQLGRPGAAQAVGQAVGRNALAGVIPCHRVVCADGRLSGFRWGSARKARWLEYEHSSQKYAQTE